MNDFDESELSAEDLEVLRAFDAMSSWEAALTELSNGTISVQAPDTLSSPPSGPAEEANDIFRLFVSEVKEDIARMERTLSQLEQDDQIQPERFIPIKRSAHKIRGTAGAVECPGMATMAHYAE